MSLRREHLTIMMLLSPDFWVQVPEYTLGQTPGGQERRYKIGGRKARLRELMELGYVHVRTANYSPWFSKRSDPHPKYDTTQWQAILTEQGLDVLMAHSPDCEDICQTQCKGQCGVW